jgi:hypothetical protein
LREDSDLEEKGDKMWLIRQLEYFRHINERDAKIKRGEEVLPLEKSLLKPLAIMQPEQKFILHVDKKG